MSPGTVTVPISTSAGTFLGTFAGDALIELRFPSSTHRGVRRALRRPEMERLVQTTRAALEACLRGERPARIPPLDLSRGTPFQQRVWSALRDIAPGQTQTYGDIAAALGLPNAARAVGGACGANPIPVIIPCHRVLASGGRLGGFSGGLNWKRQLLEAEKALPPGPKRTASNGH